jgi:hypothetical protein
MKLLFRKVIAERKDIELHASDCFRSSEMNSPLNPLRYLAPNLPGVTNWSQNGYGNGRQDPMTNFPALLFALILPPVTLPCISLNDACLQMRFVAPATDCLSIVRVAFVELRGGSSDIYGGALLIDTESTVLISESRFIACSLPTNPASGGACFLSNPTKAMIENCCASNCFAGYGQFLWLDGKTKNGHSINCSSMLSCGGSTSSGVVAMGISLYDLSATIESLNSTRCSVPNYGAGFACAF